MRALPADSQPQRQQQRWQSYGLAFRRPPFTLRGTTPDPRRPYGGRAQLFLAVLRSMSLHRLFSMPSGMDYVTPRSMSVVCRLFVMSSTMVLGGFLVVVGGVLKMFGCLRVVLSSFLRHGICSKAV